MRIALAQTNSHLGDFSYNRKNIVSYIKRAKDRYCDLVVFPELTLFGYWPADLLERDHLIQDQLKELSKVCSTMPEGIQALVGVVTLNPSKFGKRYYNSAALVTRGKIKKIYHKVNLPNYDVFDEARHFANGDITKNIIDIKGKRILVTICEDIWASETAWRGSRQPKNPLIQMKGKKIDVVVNLSASPFSIGKIERRKKVCAAVTQLLKAPIIYVNRVGAQDEIIFDGGSFVLDKKGNELGECIFFEEDINVFDLNKNESGRRHRQEDWQECTRQALVHGLREYVSRNGFRKVHLGLSGGIDSALVACLAVDALGPQNVTCIAMPGPYTEKESIDLSLKLAENLGCKAYQLPILKSYESSIAEMKDVFLNDNFGIVHENLQARLRGLYLMAYSNQNGSLLLSTGNKSEYSVGYSTLYGDMCGGIAPIADLLKTQVFEMAKYYNSQDELIPNRIIDRPPSAELRPNQKDEDSLPPYKELDKSIQKIVVECKKPTTKIDKFLYEKLKNNEFKRWQAPPILRVSQHAFGTGRRYPLSYGKSSLEN